MSTNAEAVPRPDLVRVPGGPITMRDARSKSSRDVDLTSFLLGPTQVTWKLYNAVSAGITAAAEAHPDRPADSISWLEAVTWCNAASLRAGLAPAYVIVGDDVEWDVGADGYRLPTDAEWEYACRAGTPGPTYGPLAEIAWTEADNLTSPHTVAQKDPNAFGLFDMLGNVWEWCWDYLDTDRYQSYRVFRGGGWADKHWSVRASVRRGSMATIHLDDVGFRVARKDS